MKIKNLFSWLFVLAIGFAAVSCSDDDEPKWNDDGSKVVLPDHRMFILNEGSFNQNNAGIEFYAPMGDASVIDDIFYRQNNARLGDTAQDMIEYRNYIYVSVYGSNYLAKLNTACVEVARVSFANNSDLNAGIRYLAADGGYIYASFHGGSVAKINASTLAVEATFKTPGANLEGIAVENGKLYVANSYGQGTGGYTYYTDVFVIDTKTFTLVKTLEVALNPNAMTEEDDKIFLISTGNYGDKGYSFQMIDPSRNDAVTDLAVATCMGAGNDKVYLVNSVTDWTTYQTTNTFFSYDIKSGRVINESFMKNAPAELSSVSIYMISVDDETGDIYVGVTYYSAGNGDIYRFKKDGTFVEKFDCGGQNPRAAVFFD